MLEAYGAQPGDGSFASNCLLARRLAERGVRFIQLYHRDWDHHGGVKTAFNKSRRSGQAHGGADHRSETARNARRHADRLGRRIRAHADVAGGDGRDHHIKGFSFMVAGGGIKRGLSYGATDELGYAAVENPVSVHDFHATMLHLLGIDDKRMTVKFQGLDARLSGGATRAPWFRFVGVRLESTSVFFASILSAAPLAFSSVSKSLNAPFDLAIATMAFASAGSAVKRRRFRRHRPCLRSLWHQDRSSWSGTPGLSRGHPVQ